MRNRRLPVLGWIFCGVTLLLIWKAAEAAPSTTDQEVVQKFFASTHQPSVAPVKKRRVCTPCAERQGKGRTETDALLSDIIGTSLRMDEPSVTERSIAPVALNGIGNVVLGYPKRQHRVTYVSDSAHALTIVGMEGASNGVTAVVNSANVSTSSSSAVICLDFRILLDDLRLVQGMCGMTHRLGEVLGTLTLTECTRSELVWTDADAQGELIIRLTTRGDCKVAERVRVTSLDGQPKPHRTVIWPQADESKLDPKPQ